MSRSCINEKHNSSSNSSSPANGIATVRLRTLPVTERKRGAQKGIATIRLHTLVLDRQQTHGSKNWIPSSTPGKQTQLKKHATEGTMHFTHELWVETGVGYNKDRTESWVGVVKATEMANWALN